MIKFFRLPSSTSKKKFDRINNDSLRAFYFVFIDKLYLYAEYLLSLNDNISIFINDRKL